MSDKSKYSVETVKQIWDDRHGSRLEVGPDRDGLDLVDIRSYSDDNKCTEFTTTQEQALLLAEAILELYKRV